MTTCCAHLSACNDDVSRFANTQRQVTKDGKRSAQFEHTFIVTETGVEILTERGCATSKDTAHNVQHKNVQHTT
jgi:hypothetical protein